MGVAFYSNRFARTEGDFDTYFLRPILDEHSIYRASFNGDTEKDWGDGVIDSNSGHVYPGDCIYPVTTNEPLIAYAFDNTLIAAYVSSIGKLGQNSFRNCTSVLSVAINGEVAIPVSCFEGCTSLKTVVIPLSLREIKNYAFKGCVSLAEMCYNGTMSEFASITKGTDWNYGAGSFVVRCSDGNIQY